MKKDIRYIMCGDHKKRRWAIVCVHLTTGGSRMWNPVQGSAKDVLDYFCPECLRDLDHIERDLDLTDLLPVCVECIKKLRTMYDPSYPPYRAAHCAFSI